MLQHGECRVCRVWAGYTLYISQLTVGVDVIDEISQLF